MQYTKFEKLCKLERIEEELEIDLITLFKALKQKIIYVKGHGYKSFSLIYDNYTERYYLSVKDITGYISLRSYGKTWALREEELL